MFLINLTRAVFFSNTALSFVLLSILPFSFVYIIYEVKKSIIIVFYFHYNYIIERKNRFKPLSGFADERGSFGNGVGYVYEHCRDFFAGNGDAEKSVYL